MFGRRKQEFQCLEGYAAMESSQGQLTQQESLPTWLINLLVIGWAPQVLQSIQPGQHSG